MKLVLLTEGDTERDILGPFLHRWLDSRLPQKVQIRPHRVKGCHELIREMPKLTRRYLNEPDSSTIGVIGLLDLYGPQKFYPPHLKDSQEKVVWGTKRLESDVNQPRFRMFFAVHELEAWLLSDPAIFPTEVRKAFPGRVKNPEEVNFDEPPAKLLDRLYKEKLSQRGRERIYRKRIDGAELFGKLDPQRVYEKCPNFKAMMDAMLEMAAYE